MGKLINFLILLAIGLIIGTLIAMQDKADAQEEYACAYWTDPIARIEEESGIYFADWEPGGAEEAEYVEVTRLLELYEVDPEGFYEVWDECVSHYYDIADAIEEAEYEARVAGREGYWRMWDKVYLEGKYFDKGAAVAVGVCHRTAACKL